MGIIRRQISDDEKRQILETHGRICYATGHEISENQEIQFDHIKAFADKGASDINNIAPMCREHNQKKGMLPLHDFRIKLQMDEFFNEGQKLTLKDELHYFKNKNEITEFGQNCYSEIVEDKIKLEISNRKSNYSLFTCPTTEWKYFYAIIPVEAINSDDDEDGEVGLQPRYLILDKVFNLYRHFQRHPVLQPSIARLQKDKILVFDGQHKIAAMLWEGKRAFDLKVYLDPDPKILNNTNIAAHEKFAQTRFYSSIMVAKLGSQFGKQFEFYKNREDEEKKSEHGFVEYLRTTDQLTKAEVNKKFNSFLYHAVLDSEDNTLAKLVSASNRSSDEYPLTVDMLSKSIFSNFLYRVPLEEDLASEHYKRNEEIDNVIKLCNMLYSEALHAWDAKLGKSNLNQIKLARVFGSKSIMAWAELVRDSVAARLQVFDADHKKQLFYRELQEAQLEEIQQIVRRLLNWKIWSSPKDSAIDSALAGNKSAVKKYMDDNELTTGYLLGA